MARGPVLFVAAVVLASFVCFDTVLAQDCVWNAPNGKVYDLTPLKKVGSFYEGQEGTSYTYYLNFCTDAISPVCNSATGQMSFEKLTNGGNCAALVPSSASPTFEFKNGMDDADGIVAKFGGNGKNVHFEMKCGAQAQPSTPFSVQYTSTAYKVTGLVTSAACGNGSPPTQKPSPVPTAPATPSAQPPATEVPSPIPGDDNDDGGDGGHFRIIAIFFVAVGFCLPWMKPGNQGDSDAAAQSQTA